MIALVVTLRGPGKESDPEPKFSRRRQLPARAFDATATLQAIEQERCTTLYGVPTMFLAELSALDLGTYHLPTLRTGIMAGAPCPMSLLNLALSRGELSRS